MANRNVRKSVRKDEKAVSPVIGVILMVAITVILAAVIGAFVFGMGGSLKKTYSVGVTASQTDATHVDVTFQGGPDAVLVHYMNVSVDGSEFRCAAAGDTTAIIAAVSGTNGPVFGSEAAIPPASTSTVPVGTARTLNDATNVVISSGRDHLVVTAAFMDGTKQIVLDTYV